MSQIISLLNLMHFASISPFFRMIGFWIRYNPYSHSLISPFSHICNSVLQKYSSKKKTYSAVKVCMIPTKGLKEADFNLQPRYTLITQ